MSINTPEYQRAYRASHLEESRGYNRKYYSTHVEEFAAKNKPIYQEYRAFLAQLKDVPCAECGESFPTHKMHFHHIDPDSKLFWIAQGGTRSRDKVLAEIDKCEVVCVYCHGKITQEQQ